ncbi:MAG: hypothetical protein CMJ64_30115 [Planctomycetaceae bacterium]|nr:hypothetical protein [Planctomycetaceae bacterium]
MLVAALIMVGSAVLCYLPLPLPASQSKANVSRRSEFARDSLTVSRGEADLDEILSDIAEEVAMFWHHESV